MNELFQDCLSAVIVWVTASLCLIGVASAAPANAPGAPLVPLANANQGVPILLYHRFGPTVADSMTTTTAVFEAQLNFLHANGYSVIPLRTVVDWVLGKGPVPPPRSVVITADDGHRSVSTVMLPLVMRYHIPVTLFIYPSAISNASYAMTWEELAKLKQTGLFDIQSHTFWHPNFKVEKRRLAPAAYQKLVDSQLRKPIAILKARLGVSADLLAWPFGIYSPELMQDAAQAGYVAAFTIDHRRANRSYNAMALPRYLLNNSDRGAVFTRIVGGGLTEVRPGALIPAKMTRPGPSAPRQSLPAKHAL
jgi:peptidoglycan/xylan/chitin deacetylase (PgdA/CDA1 family)